MGGEKNQSKRKEKNNQRLGECGELQILWLQNVKKKTHTHKQLGGREGGQSDKKFWKTRSLNLSQLLMISNSSLCSQNVRPLS
jgi:hypothetical protein